MTVKDRGDRYYKLHGAEIRARQKTFRAANPGYASKWHLKQRYGLTPEDRALLLGKQGGGCAICGTKKDLVIDHVHVEGYEKLPPDQKKKLVRGILCRAHNAALGLFSELPDLLRSAADYLERTKCAMVGS